ncbi:MAG TPA: BamA/TamA family outer membrane protein, partial [Acidobacteriota bacterium]
VDMRIAEGTAGKVINITPHVRGPSSLSFTARYNDKEELIGIARHSYQRFGGRSSSLITKAEFGAIFDLEASYMDYALFSTGLFFRTSVFLNDNFEFLFDDQAPIARFDKNQRGLAVTAGNIFSNSGEVGLTFERKKASFAFDSGIAPFADVSDDVSLLRVSAEFDTTDRFAFSRSGTAIHVSYENAGRYLGGDVSFQRLHFQGDHYVSFAERHTVSFGVRGGTGFNTDLPPYVEFVIGGPNTLIGYARDELRGRKAVTVNAGYRYQILDFLVFTKRSVYATLKLQAGDAWESLIDDQRDFRFRYGGSVGIAVDTIIGPVNIDFAGGDGGRRHIYFSAGYDL